MALNLTTTKEIAAHDRLRCFFYGLPGSGKTHLAGTFPAPLFIVPEKIAEELRTCGDAHLTAATFGDVQGFLDTVNEVSKLLKVGKKIGKYKPQSIIIDSTTEIQNMIEHEILVGRWKDQGEDGNFPTLRDRDWGMMYNVLMSTRNMLYSIPGTHIIWIGHAKQREVNVSQGKKRETKIVKDIVLRGDAKNFIPNSCNVLSYLKCKPMGTDAETGNPKTAYYLYGRPNEGWNSRIHLPSSQVGFLRLGGESTPDNAKPTYDQLAPYFGLPSRDECEEGIEFGAIETRKAKEASPEKTSSVGLTPKKKKPERPKTTAKGKTK